MPIKRVVRKPKPPKVEPGDSTSQIMDHIPSTPFRLKQCINPKEKEGLLQYWDPETLEWVLDNENLRLGDLVEWGMAINRAIEEDKVD